MSDTSGLQKAAIEKEVRRQLYEQQEELAKAVVQGIEETDSMYNICAKMVVNGIEIAARITAVMAAEMLYAVGACEPRDDDELRRELFSVVREKD